MITHISPLGAMDLLSQLEVNMLKRTASSDLYRLFRNCSLAVLNSGIQTDSSKELLERFQEAPGGTNISIWPTPPISSIWYFPSCATPARCTWAKRQI